MGWDGMLKTNTAYGGLFDGKTAPRGAKATAVDDAERQA